MINLYYNKSIEYEKEELPVRLILTMLPHNINNIIFTSVDEIGYYMTGRFLNSQKDKRLLAVIKKGLQLLIDSNEIRCIDKNKNNYILDSNSCKVDTKKYSFTIIELWELQKIMSLGVNGLDILHFFINLIGTINYTKDGNKSFHLSQEDMCNYWGTNFMTISKYNTVLEDFKLIYVHKPNLRKKDGTFHKINNCYGRYRDKESIIMDSKNYSNNIESYHINLNIDRTSIKLQYNAFVRGNAKKYKDDRVVLELYRKCIEYNKSLKVKENSNLTELDLSVFKRCNFYIENDQWGENDNINTDNILEPELYDYFGYDNDKIEEINIDDIANEDNKQDIELDIFNDVNDDIAC